MSDERTDFPDAFDERTTLTQLLKYVRLTVHAKCEGLSREDAVKTPLPGSPAMSVAGLVSHLRWVEVFWIDVIFLGRPRHNGHLDILRELADGVTGD